MKSLSPLMVGVVFAIGSTPAWAQPRKYTNCAVNQIQSPANSSGFYMSADCKTAYVLPPSKGAIDVSAYVDEFDSSSSLCGNVQETDRTLKEARNELHDLDEHLQDLETQASETRKRCDSVESATSVAEAKLTANRAEQAKTSQEIAQLDAKIAACTADDCETLRSLRQVKADRLEMLQIREGGLDSTFQRTSIRQSTCKLEQARALKTLTDEASRGKTRQTQLKTQVTQLSQVLKDTFDDQSGESGALMSVSISSEQTKLVEQFRKLNQSSGIQFTEMPMTDMSLSFTQIRDGVAAKYPILYSANVTGVTVNADNSLQSLPFNAASASNQQVVFGAAVGGQLRLNRFAACQLPSAKNYGSSDPAVRRRIKDIAAQIGGTSTYRYQLGVSRKITIQYNEKQLYCLIKKQSTSNGFFHSSSSTSITESSQASQWLDIEVSSEDTSFDFADRDTLLMDLRREMLDNALMKVAKSYLSKERAQLIAPGEQGAPQASRELRKCPNLYCQVGAVVIDLAHSLFGGSSSSSTTCEDVGVKSTQKYVDTRPVAAYGTQAFTIRGK